MLLSVEVKAQDSINYSTRTFTLEQCINLATDSTLQAFRAKNLYLAGYWQYRSWLAGRMPSVSLHLTPVQYNSTYTKRYDFNDNIEVYRLQQSVLSSGSLSISQIIEPTGGTVTLSSDIEYLRYFGQSTFTQYSTVPVRLSYMQSLFGFNAFKWNKRLEPLQYEKTCKQYQYDCETIAVSACNYFFALALARLEHEMAKEKLLSSDSLVLAAKERARISTISQAELQTVELDQVNALNAVEQSLTNLQKAEYAFAGFLRLERVDNIRLILPNASDIPQKMTIEAAHALAQMRSHHPNILYHREQVLESEREVERIRKTGGFDASVSVGLGFNQAGSTIKEAYTRPSRQQIAGVSLNIPLVDWGIRKGQLNMAVSNLEVTRMTVAQSEQELEQELLLTVAEFGKQQRLLASTSKVLSMAQSSFQLYKRRFIVGRSDVNAVLLAFGRWEDARRNYLLALSNYWSSYYNLRRLTLYDYQKNEPL